MPPRPTASAAQKPQAKSKQKPPAKRKISSEERLKLLYRSLCSQIDGGYFRNALKTCDKILRIEPKDADALQTKPFLLLQTEQYENALALLQSLSDAAAHEYEQAYALYRLHREPEAGDVLSRLKDTPRVGGVHDRGVMHLEAQLAYRQCSYQDAFDHYSHLLDSSSADSEEHADLLTNLNAAQTHLEFLTTGYLHALDALPASVINGLESTAPPAPPGSAAIPNAALAPSTTPGPTAQPVEKKVRLSRVPKGVTPGVTPPPDPERWLKKSERTTFGQGAGRRRKAGGGGATQGSVAEASPSHTAKSGGTAKHKKKK